MPDQLLWVTSLGQKEVRAVTRIIRPSPDSADAAGVELRILKDGDLYQSELFRDLKQLHARSMELLQKLMEKGWTTCDV